jgi:hypothetical protein
LSPSSCMSVTVLMGVDFLMLAMGQGRVNNKVG